MKSIAVGLLLLSAVIGLTLASPFEFKEPETGIAAAAVVDPTYRLPTNVLPSRYELDITPYFVNETGKQEFTFDGEVRITLRATTAGVRSIVLHRNDLEVSFFALSGAVGVVNGDLTNMQYDSLRDLWTIPLPSDLPQNADSTLKVIYKGYMRDDMAGFYKSYYMENNQKVFMASTQFQSTSARRAFPCFDEPGIKAIFKLRMIRPKDMKTISNTRSTTVPGPSRDTDEFDETPLMSTYLLAFIVSKYNGNWDTTDEKNSTFGVYARPESHNVTQMSLEFGQKMLRQFGTYLGIDYYTYMRKMDMAAIPDFSAGAMENWGLLTYRETGVLYYPEDTPTINEQRIVAVIAHEQAHMWFGDLVTCKWWSETWLNEGFARYFQYFGPAMITGYTNWQLEEQFVVENLQQSMQLDSTDDTHPMTDDTVSTRAQAAAMFDNISYNKGASIIRMLKHYIGEAKFQQTLKNYLDQNRLLAVTPDKLFTAVDTVNPATPSITADFWAAWTITPGFPLVTVERDNLKLTLHQKRFMRSEEGNNKAETYNIPINVAIDSDDYSNTLPDFVFRINSANRSMTYNLTKSVENFYILNKQQTGFYRVNYDESNWNAIKTALMTSDHGKIHVMNRAQIVDDLFNLARAGIVEYGTAIDIIRYIKKEKNYIPWLSAINNGLTFLSQRVSGDANQEVFKWFVLDLMNEIYDHLKFDQPTTSETRTDIYNRVQIQNWVCKYGHEECIAKSKEHFDKFMAGTKVPKNQRATVYCNAVRNGDASKFNFLFERLPKEDISAEQLNLLAGMGCTKDATLVKKLLDLILDDTIRPQDRASTINNVLNSNPEGPKLLFNYITDPATTNNWKAKMGSLSTLTTVAQRYTTAEEFTAHETFLTAQKTNLGSDYDSLLAAMTAAKKNLEWDSKHMKSFMDHLAELKKNSAPVKVISIAISMISLAILYIFN